MSENCEAFKRTIPQTNASTAYNKTRNIVTKGRFFGNSSQGRIRHLITGFGRTAFGSRRMRLVCRLFTIYAPKIDTRVLYLFAYIERLSRETPLQFRKMRHFLCQYVYFNCFSPSGRHRQRLCFPG